MTIKLVTRLHGEMTGEAVDALTVATFQMTLPRGACVLHGTRHEPPLGLVEGILDGLPPAPRALDDDEIEASIFENDVDSGVLPDPRAEADDEDEEDFDDEDDEDDEDLDDEDFDDEDEDDEG